MKKKRMTVIFAVWKKKWKKEWRSDFLLSKSM